MAQYAPAFVTALLSDYDCSVILPNWLSASSRRAYGLEHKPDSPPRTDGRRRPRLLQLFPQPSDVGIDDVRARIEMHVPHFVVQLTSRHRLARAKHEVLVKLQLHRRETYVVAVAGHSASEAIECEIADVSLLADARAPRTPPNEGAHTRSQLLIRDWLDDVVVGARIETADNRFGVGATRVEEDRGVSAVAPQLLQDLESMPVAKLKIEDNSIVVVHEGESTCLFARGRHVYGVGFVAKHSGDQLQYRLVVIDYEDAHLAPGSFGNLQPGAADAWSIA